jgi:hypothetical protein
MTPIPEPRAQWFEPLPTTRDQLFLYNGGERPIYVPTPIPQHVPPHVREMMDYQNRAKYEVALQEMRDIMKEIG